jgi:hypothetical protein
MKSIQINRRVLSRVIWQQMGDGYLTAALFHQLKECDALRPKADYNTGSISKGDAQELYNLVRYFAPQVIAEVGTFIGRSTLSMAHGMKTGTIYTCDASNDLPLPSPTGCECTIYQFPRQTATEMFKQLVEKGVKIDLFFIDGRLTKDDLPYLNSLMHERTIFVFDDFEGIEKGVANVALLMSQLGAYYVLVYPKGRGKTAMMLPRTLLEFTNQ